MSGEGTWRDPDDRGDAPSRSGGEELLMPAAEKAEVGGADRQPDRNVIESASLHGDAW